MEILTIDRALAEFELLLDKVFAELSGILDRTEGAHFVGTLGVLVLLAQVASLYRHPTAEEIEKHDAYWNALKAPAGAGWDDDTRRAFKRMARVIRRTGPRSDQEAVRQFAADFLPKQYHSRHVVQVLAALYRNGLAHGLRPKVGVSRDGERFVSVVAWMQVLDPQSGRPLPHPLSDLREKSRYYVERLRRDHLVLSDESGAWEFLISPHLLFLDVEKAARDFVVQLKNPSKDDLRNRFLIGFARSREPLQLDASQENLKGRMA